MDRDRSSGPELEQLSERFIGAWNEQAVERVLDCYTDQLIYRDPNTRNSILGKPAMRKHLGRLFAQWDMHWTVKEIHPFPTRNGAAILWLPLAGFPAAQRMRIIRVAGRVGKLVS